MQQTTIPIPVNDETKAVIQRLVSGTRDWDLLKKYLQDRVDFYGAQFWTHAPSEVKMAVLQASGNALASLISDLEAYKIEITTESQ